MRDYGASNIFDALEFVAKTVLKMPTKTFGDVLADIRKRTALSPDMTAVLQKLYDMANNHFRHGMTKPFTLRAFPRSTSSWFRALPAFSGSCVYD